MHWNGLRPIVAFALLTSAGAVYASEPTAADRATARQLMFEGRTLRHDGNLRGALERFRAADALMGVPTTGLELARTQAALGMLVEALDSCTRVIHHAETSDEPPPFREARKAAIELRAELHRRTPSLRFVLPAHADTRELHLQVDGVDIPPATFAVPRLVNPGRHVVELIAGARRQAISVSLAERETREIVLAFSQGEPTAPPPPHDDGEARRRWIWGGFATAAVGGTVGTVTGLIAWSQRNDLDTSCPGRVCSADDMDRVERAKGYANASTYAFVLGGVGAAVGVGALLLPGGDKGDSGARATVVRCSAGTLCVSGRF